MEHEPQSALERAAELAVHAGRSLVGRLPLAHSAWHWIDRYAIQPAAHGRRRLVDEYRLSRQPHEDWTPLMHAASRGDVRGVERLLHAGADPNAADARGWTALHIAAARDRADAAACLLSYGASPTRSDAAGRPALSRKYTGMPQLHAIRQRYQRFSRSQATGLAASSRAADWARALHERGIVRVSGLIEPEELARLRVDFSAFVDHLDQKLARGEGIYRAYDEEEHYWPSDRAYVTNNAFKYSAELTRLCCKPDLTGCANLYMQRRTFVQRGVAMRYLPWETRDHDMFSWHHDMEEKRFKVMVLLTDVGEHDQPMSYVLGSHRIHHPYAMFLDNPCSLAYCQKQLPAVEIFATIGRAGDVFLFDSNGIHRGNRRSNASVRDAFFVEYSADRSSLWGGDVDRAVLAELPVGTANPFERMVEAPKRWELPTMRQSTTWAASMGRFETWL